MQKSFSNIFTNEEIECILQDPAVIIAKEKLYSGRNHSVSFSISLTQSMKEKIFEIFGLDLFFHTSIPMRWIKGDTLPHIDKSVSEFENTHLIYLTDSPGKLIIDNQLYPISQNTGYVFSEGFPHETKHTGDEPRLLLGPMSEQGLAVGAATTIVADGQTDIVYFTYISSGPSTGLFYRINNGDTYGTSTPIFIQNTNTSYMLKVLFETNIEIYSSGTYIICNSGSIQFGSESLNTDGNRRVIIVDNVINYQGFIRNGENGNNGFDNVHIFNLSVDAINGSQLQQGGGWLAQEYFGNGAIGNYIINCTTNGDIAQDAGGIVGQYSGSGTGASLTIEGCSSSGSIDSQGGGIVGASAGNNGGTVTCESCFTTGLIQINSGGIVGEGSNIGTIVVSNCYSTGTIQDGAGGICGPNFGSSGGSATISNCYSTGSIGASGGGILGASSTNTIVSNCYTTGDVLAAGGGCLIGPTAGSVTTINCYTVGNVTGVLGYIVGNSSMVPANCYSEAKTGTPGSWSTTNANTVLTGVPTSVVGATWVATQTNQPYELRRMGFTPYTLEIIDISTPTLQRTFNETITVGGISSEAIHPDASGNAFEILQIEGGDSGSYSAISMSSQTGAITVPSSTTLGIYTIYVRNPGSYNITIFILTIIGATVAEISCCEKAMNLQGLDYRRRNDILAGNTLIGGGIQNRRSALRYADIIKIKMAYAAKIE